MASADARKESEGALGKAYIGTGALSVSQLFDIKGWVCVGECGRVEGGRQGGDGGGELGSLHAALSRSDMLACSAGPVSKGVADGSHRRWYRSRPRHGRRAR